MLMQQTFGIADEVTQTTASQTPVGEWVNDAVSEYHQHNVEGARFLAQRAVDLAPANAPALNLLGRIALDDNDIDNAIRLLEKAAALSCNDESIQINLGYAYLAKHQFAKGRQRFERALQISPNSDKAKISLAYTDFLDGHIEKAFAEYRRLYRNGCRNDHVVIAMADCCAYFVANSYLPELEKDIIDLFSEEKVNVELLIPLANSLLIHKYRLDHADSTIDIQTLVQDELLLNILSNNGVCNVFIEDLTTVLRQSIFVDCISNKTLPDEYLPMILAIGQQCAQNDYIFNISEEERGLIEQIHQEITDTMATNPRWSTEEIVGALLLLGMYECLFSQPFSVQIARFDLHHWPEGARGFMAMAYYIPQHRAAHAFDLRYAGAHVEQEVIAPFWLQLKSDLNRSYIGEIQSELDNYRVGLHLKCKPLRVLVLGGDAGYNAVRIASHFPETEVVAVETSIENLAHGKMMAQQMLLTNIDFVGDAPGQLNGEFDIVDCGHYLNLVPDLQVTLHQVLQMLRKGGLLRMALNNSDANPQMSQLRDFVSERALLPHIDTIRTLRQIISEDAKLGEWQDICGSRWFYHRQSFVNHVFKHQNGFVIGDVLQICQLHEMNFIGFCQLGEVSASESVKAGSNHQLIQKRQQQAYWKFISQKEAATVGEVIFIKPGIML